MYVLLLTALIMFQSCVVYHKTPVPLEQASQTRTKSKLIMPDGAVAEYKYLTEEKGVYYGVKKKKGDLQKTPIESHPDLEVFLKNEADSRWASLSLIIAPVGIGYLLAWANSAFWGTNF